MSRPNRRSIRLLGYDYSQPGVYFITMVTQGRVHLFGEITGGEMHLSTIGRVANKHWLAIPKHFPRVELGAYVIMPNHVHGIIVLHTDENGMAANSSPSVAIRRGDPVGRPYVGRPDGKRTETRFDRGDRGRLQNVRDTPRPTRIE